MSQPAVTPANLLQNLPANLSQEVVETLIEAGSVRIERIVSNGQKSPDGFWYDQSEDEWVIVLSGSGTLRFEGGKECVEMGPGDAVHIPAHQRHRVEATSQAEPTVWLAVHFRACDETGGNADPS